jgi:maltose-binding protein MalE
MSNLKIQKGLCMTRTLLLALTLVLSAAWMHAQTSSSQAGSSSSSSSNQTKVQGCLEGSSGNYTLKADSGTTYQLQGDTAKLSKHIGHEVEITGTTSSASSASTPSSGASTSSTASGTSGSAQESLNVEKVKHISATCSNPSK